MAYEFIDVPSVGGKYDGVMVGGNGSYENSTSDYLKEQLEANTGFSSLKDLLSDNSTITGVGSLLDSVLDNSGYTSDDSSSTLSDLVSGSNGSGYAQTGSGYAGLLDALTNYFTGNLDWERTQLQNQFNANEAQKNRDWQTEMSNTAYQRAVSDMTSAGLNPYLAYNSGGASIGGSSIGHASSYTSSNRFMSDLMRLVGTSIGSAYQLSAMNSTNATRVAIASMNNSNARWLARYNGNYEDISEMYRDAGSTYTIRSRKR